MEQLTAVCAREFHVIRMIVRKLTSGQVLGMVTPAGVRANRINTTPAIP